VTGGLAAHVELTLGRLRLAAGLTVEAGQTVVILGPNGAGKTTLLRALAGLEPIAAGAVAVDGEVLDDVTTRTFVEPERRPIGMVFQDYLLFPHMSVLDNVAFGLRCRRVRRPAARARAGDWLDRVGLSSYASALPRELSGGQAQRVALARALVTEPRLLLLDEPLAALDATTREATRRDLRRHLAAYGGATVMVTHDPIEAASLADRLVVLEDGRVVQTGSPAEISAHPRSRYVADLVGVNLLRGRAEGDRVELAGGQRLVVADRAGTEGREGGAGGSGEVFAVIHPRAVALHRRAPEGTPRNVWEGRAADIDREGERVRVRVEGAIPIVAEVTPAAVDELHLIDGGLVWVSVKATEITVFPV